MTNRLKSLWIGIRSSLWFVPSLIVSISIALALGLVEIEKYFDFAWADAYPLLFGAGAEGSRGMLSTIAGSMISVAGITFSLTIAALVTASGQYTSRILRNFMRDRRNQFVLGCFLGIFAYCLVVLRTIRGTIEGNFIPSLAVFTGLLLALLGIGILVFFIHHIASSIQASTIIASITSEALAAVDERFPADLGAGDSATEARQAIAQLAGEPLHDVPATARGYVQVIDVDALVRAAGKRHTLVQMDVRPGEFVTDGAPLMVIGGTGTYDEELIGQFRDAVSISPFRTIDQEPGFGIRQLVDIALKALSPGINDTTTAVMCIDHLGAVVARLVSRAMPQSFHGDDGRIRLITRGPTFADALDAAFDQIRNSASGNVAVLAHLLRAIAYVANCTGDAGRRDALRHHVALVADLTHRTVEVDHDRAKVNVQLDEALAALDHPRCVAPSSPAA